MMTTGRAYAITLLSDGGGIRGELIGTFLSSNQDERSNITELNFTWGWISTYELGPVHDISPNPPAYPPVVS